MQRGFVWKIISAIHCERRWTRRDLASRTDVRTPSLYVSVVVDIVISTHGKKLVHTNGPVTRKHACLGEGLTLTFSFFNVVVVARIRRYASVGGRGSNRMGC